MTYLQRDYCEEVLLCSFGDCVAERSPGQVAPGSEVQVKVALLLCGDLVKFWGVRSGKNSRRSDAGSRSPGEGGFTVDQVRESVDTNSATGIPSDETLNRRPLHSTMSPKHGPWLLTPWHKIQLAALAAAMNEGGTGNAIVDEEAFRKAKEWLVFHHVNSTRIFEIEQQLRRMMAMLRPTNAPALSPAATRFTPQVPPTPARRPPGHICRQEDIDIPPLARFQCRVCGHRYFSDKYPTRPPNCPREWQEMVNNETEEQRRFWDGVYQVQNHQRTDLKRDRHDEDDGRGARRHKKG